MVSVCQPLSLCLSVIFQETSFQCVQMKTFNVNTISIALRNRLIMCLSQYVTSFKQVFHENRKFFPCVASDHKGKILRHARCGRKILPLCITRWFNQQGQILSPGRFLANYPC